MFLAPLLALPLLVLSSPVHPTANRTRPLVLWHGLGDSHTSPGMVEFAELIKDIHPDVFIHSIYIDENNDADRQAGFYGNANKQSELAAAQLANITELSDGFDAIGFSQGGQFLRAYVERYNTPPVHNLITFGSQHMGVSDLPACRPGDWTCKLAMRAARGGVYRKWAQENLIPAQYYRDPARYATYLSTNTFLTSINNEIRVARNATYKENFETLANLVLVLFVRDKTVVPKESSWFGSEPIPAHPRHALPSSDEDAEGQGEAMPSQDAEMAQTLLARPHLPTTDPPADIVPMRLQPLYTEDWIGLRTLDKRGAVHLESCPGEHMELESSCWEWIVKKFCGGKLG